jgi:hypothetical protein
MLVPVTKLGFPEFTRLSLANCLATAPIDARA